MIPCALCVSSLTIPRSLLLRSPGALLVLLILLAACSDPTGPGAPGGLRISPAVSTLEAGSELQLLAVFVSVDGDTVPVEGILWSSSDPDVASISSDGRVTGLRSGAATIVGLHGSERATAVLQVERRFKASAVAVGPSHICAIDLSMQAWCFGQDAGGSLGLGAFWQSTPTMTAPVLGGLAFSSISISGAATCGLSAAGQAWCWGYNPSAALGHFPRGEDSAVPVLADTLRSYEFLTSGASKTCGLSAGELYCWGLGYGAPRRPLQDQDIRFTSVSLTAYEDCGLTTEGLAVCWQDNPFTNASGPAAPRFIRLSTSHDWDGRGAYVCGVTIDRIGYCWGSNSHGQLGDGSTTSRDTPGPAAIEGRLSDITASMTFACGLTEAGIALCWGANDHGQLGHGDSTATATPRDVATSVRFSSISANPGTYLGPAGNRVCAISIDRDLFCWGEGFGPTPAPVLY